MSSGTMPTGSAVPLLAAARAASSSPLPCDCMSSLMKSSAWSCWPSACIEANGVHANSTLDVPIASNRSRIANEMRSRHRQSIGATAASLGEESSPSPLSPSPAASPSPASSPPSLLSAPSRLGVSWLGWQKHSGPAHASTMVFQATRLALRTRPHAHTARARTHTREHDAKVALARCRTEVSEPAGLLTAVGGNDSSTSASCAFVSSAPWPAASTSSPSTSGAAEPSTGNEAVACETLSGSKVAVGPKPVYPEADCDSPSPAPPRRATASASASSSVAQVCAYTISICASCSSRARVVVSADAAVSMTCHDEPKHLSETTRWASGSSSLAAGDGAAFGSTSASLGVLSTALAAEASSPSAASAAALAAAAAAARALSAARAASRCASSAAIRWRSNAASAPHNSMSLASRTTAAVASARSTRATNRSPRTRIRAASSNIFSNGAAVLTTASASAAVSAASSSAAPGSLGFHALE